MNEEDFGVCCSALLQAGEMIEQVLKDMESTQEEDIKRVGDCLKIIHEKVSSSE